MAKARRDPQPGPFRAHQLAPGDRYELSNGHAIRVLPTGGQGARGNLVGGESLDTDPAVEQAGVDAGYSPSPTELRAPDIAIGNVPDEPGWVKGAPLLAVEYADVGQDEAGLQRKIADLLDAGTRWVWVVRLAGPRRVEVYAPGEPVRTLGAGERLTAPGVLRNPVPVEALWDRPAAHEHTLRNLLQRKGYAGLDDVIERGRAEGREQGRAEGREQGRTEGLRAAVRDLCEVIGIPLDPGRAARVAVATASELESLATGLKRDRRWPAD